MGRLNRRIPNELRKRSAQSCDLCKTKRCKCVPSGEGNTCVSCLEQRLECTYTVPRKQRYYGSIENLSDRYRCLEAIVKGAFPDDDHATTEGLLQLGAKLGVEMPDIHNPSRHTVPMENLLRNPEPPTPAPSGHSTNGTVRSSEDRRDSSKDGNGSDRSAYTPPNEIVKDSSGNEYYIGPSGTLAFFNQLKDVFVSTQVPPAALKQASDYKLNTTETLESSTDEQSGWDQALSHLLPWQLIEVLMDSYFKTTHMDFPLFHQATFRNECKLLVMQSQDPSGASRIPDWGLLGSLYMVMVFGSISNPAIHGVDHSLLQQRYVAATRNLLPHLIQKCALPNLRSLVLLSLYLHNNGERNATWNLTGTAVRMAFALGLHRKGNPATADSPTSHSKKLVLSSLYSYELFLAASLGRPSALNDADIEIFPLSHHSTLNDDSQVDMRLLDLTVKLNSILERTRLVYSKRKHSVSPASPGGSSGVDDILTRLKVWRDELKDHPDLDLPTFLKSGINGTYHAVDGPSQDIHEYIGQLTNDSTTTSPSSSPPSNLRGKLMLHIQFHYIGIVTTRHFLLHDITASRMSTTKPGGAEGISTLATTCCFHSFQLACTFLLLDELKLVNGNTGLDIFYGYWAGMLLNLLLLRPKGEAPILIKGPDGTMICFLSNFVRQLQQIIHRVDKSVTMKRLSSIFDTFVEWAQRVSRDQPDPAPLQGPSPTTPIPKQEREVSAAAAMGPASEAMPAPMGTFPPAAQAAMNFWMSQNMMPGFGGGMGVDGNGMGGGGGGFGGGADGGMVYTGLNGYYGDDHAAMLGMVDMELIGPQGFGPGAS